MRSENRSRKQSVNFVLIIILQGSIQFLSNRAIIVKNMWILLPVHVPVIAMKVKTVSPALVLDRDPYHQKLVTVLVVVSSTINKHVFQSERCIVLHLLDLTDVIITAVLGNILALASIITIGTLCTRGSTLIRHITLNVVILPTTREGVLVLVHQMTLAADSSRRSRSARADSPQGRLMMLHFLVDSL
jgi:hypothetical protein